MLLSRVSMTARRRKGGVPAKMIVGLLVLLAAAFVVVVAILPAPANKVPPKVAPPVNVTVMPVEPIPTMLDTIRLPGIVEPKRLVRVSAEVDGRIEKIPCREGQPCKAGDRLVLLNTELLQAEYDRAKATMDFDARELRRVTEILARGAATTNELDQSRTQAAASQAAFEGAKARLDRAVIYAPISGVLDHLPVEEGEYVTAGKPVAEIVEVDTVLVVVNVPERDVRYLKLGQAEEIRIDAMDGKAVTGTISYISEVADPAARTTRVELAVDNRDRLLRGGQIVTAQLERQKLRDVIMIPLAAAIPLEKGYTVYVVEDGKAQPRNVALGFFKGQDVRVLSGLAAGDKLIVRGHHYVGPDQPVEIVASPATLPVALRPAGAAGGAAPKGGAGDVEARP